MLGKQKFLTHQGSSRTSKNLKQEWLIALTLFLLSVFIRLPFYFVGTINWDESTVILVAQSLLDGHLPYTELWDIKPPLIFVAYALFILVFGKGIIPIRFAGSVCVFLSSWFVYKIGDRIASRGAGILAAILTIIATATFTADAQTTLSEHVALGPLFAGLALIITQGKATKYLGWGGALFTVATMIRLNLAYTVVAIGFWLLYECLQTKKVSLQGIFAYCLGSLGVILCTYLPYLITGNGSIWWNSVILAPLSYSSSEVQLDRLWQVCLAFAVLVGLWRLFKFECRWQFILLQVACLGTIISIIQGGEFHYHYFIQIFPFLALSFALFWAKLPKRILRLIAIAWLVFKLWGYVVPVSQRYAKLGERLLSGTELRSGDTYRVAKYLRLHNPENKPVYLMKHHIVYWLNDLQPLSKSATHPSNLAKDYLFPYIEGSSSSSVAELTRILAQQPEFIVKRDPLSFVDENPEIESLLAQTLAAKYQLVEEIRHKGIKQITQIYKMRSPVNDDR